MIKKPNFHSQASAVEETIKTLDLRLQVCPLGQQPKILNYFFLSLVAYCEIVLVSVETKLPITKQ